MTGNWYDAPSLCGEQSSPNLRRVQDSVATWLQTDEGKGYQEDVLMDADNNILATKTDVKMEVQQKGARHAHDSQ